MITVDFAIKMYSLANKLKHSFIFPHTRPSGASGNTATYAYEISIYTIQYRHSFKTIHLQDSYKKILPVTVWPVCNQ